METDYWNDISKTEPTEEPAKRKRVGVLLACDVEGHQTPLYLKLNGKRYKIDKIIKSYLSYSRKITYTIRIKNKVLYLYNNDKIWSIDANVFES